MDFNIDKMVAAWGLDTVLGLVFFFPSKHLSGRKQMQVGYFGSQQLPGSQAQPADVRIKPCSLAVIRHPLIEWFSNQHLASNCWWCTRHHGLQLPLSQLDELRCADCNNKLLLSVNEADVIQRHLGSNWRVAVCNTKDWFFRSRLSNPRMENVHNLLSVGALIIPTLLLPLDPTRLPNGCPCFCLPRDSRLSKIPNSKCYICLF